MNPFLFIKTTLSYMIRASTKNFSEEYHRIIHSSLYIKSIPTFIIKVTIHHIEHHEAIFVPGLAFCTMQSI